MNQYVIIGNGVAAAGCIEGIRTIDPAGQIIVISGENHPAYCRPLISYYLEGKTSLDKMNYRDQDFYEKNGCKVIYGKKAVQINPAAKTVVLDNCAEIPYDKVCVAAGSTPFVPPFAGLETVEKKYPFMTLDDTLSLESAIEKSSRVLIVGAGLIGLKCAEGLRERVGSVTVCDLADRVLSSILDSECASIMQKQLEAHGIEFMLGDSAQSFQGNKALMRSGREVDFDVLVLAVGVRANTSLVKEIGGNVNRGILVNQKMETSIPEIFAAGDCTEGQDISFGANRVLAILPNAYMQGKCAGINMAGGYAVHDKAIPMNSIGFFGLHAMTAGSYFGEADGGKMYEEKENGILKRFFIKDGFLTGYILIGDIAGAGIYTSLIREKIPLEIIDFEMLRKAATLAAMPKENRGKKLGGVV